MNSFAESQERWKSTIGGNNPFSMFEKQARANMDMFENAVRMFTPGVPTRKSKRGDKPAASTPVDDTMELLRAQMTAMQEQLDALSKR